MAIKIGTLVLVKKSEALRGQHTSFFSDKKTQLVGLVVDFRNFRNPRAGTGRESKKLFLACVVLLPMELQPQAERWAEDPEFAKSVFNGQEIPAKLANLSEWSGKTKILWDA